MRFYFESEPGRRAAVLRGPEALASRSPRISQGARASVGLRSVGDFNLASNDQLAEKNSWAPAVVSAEFGGIGARLPVNWRPAGLRILR